MFCLKRKTIYGVELLVYLAENAGKRVVPLREIAEKKKLPRKFLEQIVSSLRAAKLVKAKEGKGGGYSLAKTPSKISIAEIVEVLEGPIEVGQCSSCPMAKICTQKGIWIGVREGIRKTVKKRTLADLV